MDRFARFFCDPVKVIKALAIAVLCIGVLIYVYVQILGGSDNEIETEMSMLVTLNDTIEADAYIFRDETVIDQSSRGTVVTVVSEGERVSKGQLIANIYPDSADTTLQDDINRLQRHIDILEDSSVNTEFSTPDLSEIDRDIYDIITDICIDSEDGDLSSAIGGSSEFLIMLNRRNIISDSGFDYTAELERLKKEKREKESRISSVSSPVYATSSGYFYSNVDGYEDLFTVDRVDDITIDGFADFLETAENHENQSMGKLKIVNDFVWYLVCVIDTDDLINLKENRSYVVSFPENGDFEISMKLERIVKETSSAEAIVVFRANVLPDGFDFERFQNAEIVIRGIQGLSIPKKAFKYENGQDGVYVLVGNVIRFRSVKRIAEKDNYYIVEYVTGEQLANTENNDYETTAEPLSLYDNVVVSGKDLFDGKIVG